VKQALVASVLLLAVPALADGEVHPLPNTTIIQLELGFYQPQVGNSPGATGDAYVQTYGNSPMLIGELEVARSLSHTYGYLGISFAIGHGEKYAKALLADGQPSGESTGLIVLPMRLMAVYRYDVLSYFYKIPLVPYVELGGVCYPWWTNKGGSVEVVNGNRGAGVRWGLGFTVGLALALDFLNPTYAREAKEDSGIFNYYLFGAFNYDFPNNFGAPGINLSAPYVTFGIAFEF